MDKIAIETARTIPTFDDRPIAKRVGLVILATDHTTEPDFRRLVASDERAVYVARIAYANPTNPENLRRMHPDLTAGAALILPDEPLDAICYSCTAASVVIGDREVEAAIRTAKPGVPVVTPPLAAVHALRALGAHRIAVLTPYTIETSRPVAEYFSHRGFAVARLVCFGLEDDRIMARLDRAALVAGAVEAMVPDADALFISCTALRAAAAVPEIERSIDRPVVTSNLATAWRCLGLCEAEARPEFGRLMSLPA